MLGLLPRDYFTSSRRSSHAPPSSYRDPYSRSRDAYTTPPRRPSVHSSRHAPVLDSDDPYNMASGLSTRSGSSSTVYGGASLLDPFGSSRYGSTSGSSSRYSSTSSSSHRRSEAAYADPYYIGPGWESRPSSRSSSAANWNRPPHYEPERTPRASVSSSYRQPSTSSSHPAYTDPYYVGSGWGSQPSSSRTSSRSTRQPSTAYDIRESLPERRPSFFKRRLPSVDLYTNYSDSTYHGSRYEPETSRRSRY